MSAPEREDTPAPGVTRRDVLQGGLAAGSVALSGASAAAAPRFPQNVRVEMQFEVRAADVVT